MSTVVTFIISNLVAFILGYIANILASPHASRFRDWINNGPIREVLKLGQDDVVVVVPLHKVEQGRSLPYVAVEDVYALRNIFALLTEMHIQPKIRDPEHIEDVLTKNIISIGGPKRNSFTKVVLSDVKNIEFVDDQTTGETQIRRGPGTRLVSGSYSTPQGQKSGDMALLLRKQNPKNESNVVIVIAGIRGIGTWGASDYLRKHSRALARRLEEKHKHIGFLADIEVEYENLDIRAKLRTVDTV
jgi:hypothetical protein